MADLHFKIRADVSELEKAYKTIDNFEKKIANINKALGEVQPGGKKFKELAKELTELENQYEKSIKRIVELENVVNSLNESQKLVTITKEVTASANEATQVFVKYAGSLEELDRRVKELTKEYLSMNAAQKASSQGQGVINEISILNSQRKIEADSLRALQKEYVNTQRMQDLQEGSITALRAQLSQLTATYDNMGRSMRNSASGKELVGSIQLVTTELNEAEQASMRFNRNVGNYASGWNGLNMQVQQVARELPAMAMGANTFFLAISNNLPMLADEIKKAKTEYKAFVAEGKNATPVWKQVISSLFSWQTALVAGATILSIYGKEIISWVGSLFTAKKALSETYQSLEDFQKKVGESSGSVIATLEKLSEGWKRLGGDIDAQKKYILDNKDAINSMGVSVTDAAEAERLFNKNKDTFILGILERAKAAATMELAAEEYKKAVQKMMEADAMPDKKTHKYSNATNVIDLFKSSTWQTIEYDNPDKVAAKKQADDFIKSGTELVQKYIQFSEEEKKTIQSMNVALTGAMVDGSIEAIEAAIAFKQQSLKKVTDPKKYKQIEAEIKAEQAKLKAITGEKEKINLNNYVDSYGQSKEIQKSAQTIKDAIAQSELSIQQQQIDLMDEGSNKQLAQIRLNYEKRFAEIQKGEREALQLLQDEERKQWEKKNPDYKKKNLQFVPTITSLPQDDKNRFDTEYSLAFQKQDGDTKAFFDKMIGKYQDFAAQRESVEKQYNDDIAALQSQRTDANAEEVDRAIKVAQDKMKEATQKINDEEATASQKDSPFLKRLFGDYSQMKFDDLQKLIEEAKQLQAHLSGNGDAEGLTFITKEQLSLIAKSPTELDKLQKALDKLLKGGKSNSWDNIFENFNKGLAKLKSSKNMKDVSAGMQDIGEAASEASSVIAGVAGSLSSMFEAMGNAEAADAMSSIQDAMNAISNIGQGFAKGGLIGGIAAAVGEAANFIGKAFAANARHKEALKVIMDEATAQQRAYNLLLLEQNLLYERGVTVFGTDAYGKAKNAVDNMKESLTSLNKELAGTDEQKKRTKE